MQKETERSERKPKDEGLARAFELLASLPPDFYREDREDPPPQSRD